MNTFSKTVLATILTAGLSATALASPWSVSDTAVGKVFIGENKLSLYTFRNDAKNQSNCYADCAISWPPFLAKNDAKTNGHWTIVKRNDGNNQWAFKGAPLYYWVGDAKTGDTTGDGVGGVWDLARP